MTTVLFGLIGTALIVATPTGCLFLARPKAPEHRSRIGEVMTIGGTKFCVTHMTWDRNAIRVELLDQASFESMYRVRA